MVGFDEPKSFIHVVGTLSHAFVALVEPVIEVNAKLFAKKRFAFFLDPDRDLVFVVYVDDVCLGHGFVE